MTFLYTAKTFLGHRIVRIKTQKYLVSRNTGTRKKLNSFIQFPESLDLAGYLGSTSTPQTNYKLSAVLMHCGSSAHSGHYVGKISAVLKT
ncbi:hypothetical protein WDU94_004774 [Cyamophila willieti]